MWDLRKNFTAHRHDPVPLQTFPYPGSCMRMRLGMFHATMDRRASLRNAPTGRARVLAAQKKKSLKVPPVPQVTPASFWTPRGPTSFATAPTTASTCSTSAGSRPLQVKDDSSMGVGEGGRLCKALLLLSNPRLTVPSFFLPQWQFSVATRTPLFTSSPPSAPTTSSWPAVQVTITRTSGG